MSKQKPITKTQQNLENRLSADEIQQALGAEYQVRVCGEQYVLGTARGFEIASFRPNEGVLDVIFSIAYKPNQPLKDADDIGGDSLKAIKDRAEHEFKASHWKAWESRGFILQEIVTDWDDACNEYRFNFQLMRPVASVADITEIIRWVDDQPQDEWIR